MHSLRTRNLLLTTLIVVLTGAMIVQSLAPPVTHAQGSGTDTLPAPHLGYGVHVGPHTNVDPALVNQLNMDWVKIYEIGQAAQYPNQRVLYRMDLNWPEDWAAFRDDIRRRAAEAAGFGIDAIEVRNERNLAMEWPHGPNAWEYVHMLRVAYTEIKAADPAIIVVSGGLAPTITTADRGAVSDIDFAIEMLDNGAAEWFDAFGYHPYGYNQAPEVAPSYDTLTFRRAELIWELFEERGILDKQIWLTEFGWLRDPAEDGVQCSDSDPNFAGFAWLRVSGDTQADYTVRAYRWADSNWEWAGPMFLWNLNWSYYPPDNTPMCSHMRWFSLLRQDGSPTATFNGVATMPRGVSDYLPKLMIDAPNMTVETPQSCPGAILVGEFRVLNGGYPGQFTAEVKAAVPPGGPEVEVQPATVTNGDTVQVFADTETLPPGLHTIYLNVSAQIGDTIVAETIQGYIVVRSDGC